MSTRCDKMSMNGVRGCLQRVGRECGASLFIRTSYGRESRGNEFHSHGESSHGRHTQHILAEVAYLPPPAGKAAFPFGPIPRG